MDHLLTVVPSSLLDAWAACPDCLPGRLARGEIWDAGSLGHLAAVALPFAGIGALSLVLGRLWPRLLVACRERASRAAS
jgi:hypothetical protein